MKLTKPMKYCGLALLLLASATWSQVPDELNPYVRKHKSAAVSAELGFNSLSSLVGLKGTFFVTPQFLVDAGLGLSSVGLRPGVYGRYLFSKAKFTPFVYGGLKYGLGSGGETSPIKDTETDTEYQIKVEPSPYLDFGLGLDYLADGGFYFNAGLGWSELLGGKNYSYVGAQPSKDFDDVTQFMLGSGLAFSLSLGYAF